jgi:hypothetical protein
MYAKHDSSPYLCSYSCHKILSLVSKEESPFPPTNDTTIVIFRRLYEGMIFHFKIGLHYIIWDSQPFKVQVTRSLIGVQFPMELENFKNQDKVNPIELKTIASKLFHLRTNK